jgi:hypothetical protein
MELSDMHEPVPLQVDPVCGCGRKSNQKYSLWTYRNYSPSGLPAEDSQSRHTACNYALHVVSVDVDVIAPTHRNSPSQSYLSLPPEITIN